MKGTRTIITISG